MKMLEVLDKVLVQAMKKEPLACLYEVQAIMKEIDGYVQPDNLHQMKFVFGMPLNRTLTYDVDPNEVITERVMESPWLQDFPLPHKINNDLGAAFRRIQQANLSYQQMFSNVVLRHSLYPGVIEPAYMFHVEANRATRFVSVGLFSGDVKFVK